MKGAKQIEALFPKIYTPGPCIDWFIHASPGSMAIPAISARHRSPPSFGRRLRSSTHQRPRFSSTEWPAERHRHQRHRRTHLPCRSQRAALAPACLRIRSHPSSTFRPSRNASLGPSTPCSSAASPPPPSQRLDSTRYLCGGLVRCNRGWQRSCLRRFFAGPIRDRDAQAVVSADAVHSEKPRLLRRQGHHSARVAFAPMKLQDVLILCCVEDGSDSTAQFSVYRND